MKIGVMVGRFPVVSEQFILNHIVGDRAHRATQEAQASGWPEVSTLPNGIPDEVLDRWYQEQIGGDA